MIPVASAYNCGVCYLSYLSTPGDTIFYICQPMFAVGLSSAAVIGTAYINKLTPIDIRGAMQGIRSVWVLVNVLVYINICNLYYK